jgi:hypothetical protein
MLAPTAITDSAPNPNTNRVLLLYRTLKKPINNDNTIAIPDAAERICPATPTGTSNDIPISTNKRLVNNCGIKLAKQAKNSEREIRDLRR